LNSNSEYAEYKKVYDGNLWNQEIVDSMTCADDLLSKWYHKPFGNSTPAKNRDVKMRQAYGDRTVSGLGLELAFGLCTSSIWLLDKFPDITLDGIDFQERFLKLTPFLREIYGTRIGDYWCGDVSKINKPDNHYDFINSSSVWEHLTEDIYWKTLKECFRVLKRGGRIFVYVDQDTGGDEHIRVRPHSTIKKEMESVGFVAENDHVYHKL
jgi:ubiquinone/menaquinone biosynthesis C-methylase UbiE